MTKRCFCPKPLGALLGFAFLCVGATLTQAATIWNGPNFTFTKAAFADPTLAANQDRLTANVWITRVSQGGLINAKTETIFTHNSSPADTEWAYGDITNALSLSYTTWEQFFGGMAAGGPPTALIGSNTVMHLKTDDIYVAVKLLSWTVGSTSGGGFSYIRSTPGGAPTPTAPLLTNVALVAGQSIRFNFTNAPGVTFTVVAASNLTQAASTWSVVGTATETGPGQYQFTDAGALTNAGTRFYRVRF